MISLMDIVKEVIFPGNNPRVLEQNEKFEDNERRLQDHLQTLEQSATRLVQLTTDDVALFRVDHGLSPETPRGVPSDAESTSDEHDS